ncbi:hypothetical protein C1925_04815 [Stenotrophomonas sp. SAU14A_NAIMI4_5]|uniref:hypothetical protein n=1 Tax=Stenotrophomonas sp. SAU14A_NAIMI4_5 TaxID=2072413 RepID=UPI000D54028F|nr:hypothetical protein [Stenotrophomonas sp. SAU14A_NAIMI4_5]AWH48526.1 hypothetical protein C1925_04815 [Stenotrophomonas sp. SAU14A_NAIMI4_5]
MDEHEGVFKLVAVAGQDICSQDLWKSMGLVYAPGEAVFLEQVHAGSAFTTREAALAGGIDAARAIAKTLSPGDCRANRGARFW